MKKLTREDRRVARKEAIRLAAIEIFSTEGYHAAKVSQIVQRVGIAQGTFYLYYNSKEELFGELLNDFLTAVLDCVSRWDPVSAKDVTSLRDSVFEIGLSLTTLFVENQSLATIFFREGLGVNNDFNVLINNFYEQLAAVLCHFNRIMYRRGFIPKRNFKLTAWMIIGASERVVREYTMTNRLSDLNPQDLVEELVMFSIQGIHDPT